MTEQLHVLQPFVKGRIAWRYNDQPQALWNELRMSTTRIHQDKQPHRRHYLAEWMELRQVKPADLTRAVGADKGLVSRWLNNGVLPKPKYLAALAAFLEADDPNDLLRHPNDDWLTKFFRDRDEAEKARAKAILEAAFPKPDKAA